MGLAACVALFWAVYPQLTQLNLDTFLDMLENHVWGIRWQWGNVNHPPLFGWMTAAWFAVFPRSEIGYRVFAALNIGATLLIMLAIARRFLPPPGQVAAVMMAIVIPPLGFQAFTYNANSAMLPFWAGTVLFYLRVMEARRPLDGLLLGVCAAAAMLSKYYAAVLLMALMFHAVSHRQTRAIIATPVTVLAAGAFALLMAPHLVWLARNDFTPIVFAASGQGDASLAAQAYRQVEFLLAQPLYALPGIAMLGLLRRPGDGAPLFASGHAMAILGTARGRVLLWVGPAAVPVTMILALAIQSPLTSNWSIPVFCVVPVLLALLLPAPIAARMRGWAAGLSVGFMALMLAVSPIIGAQILERAHMNAAVPLRAIAEAAGALWSQETEYDLAFVAGQADPAYAASFYLDARPHVIDRPCIASQPWASADTLAEAGMLLVCMDPACLDAWRDDGHWRIEPLGRAQVPAVPGAGGPRSYSVHAWRAVLAAGQ